MTAPNLDLHLTCADGLENALLIELQSLDLQGQIIKTGRIATTCTLADLYHLCLYSRVASRVLLPMGDYYFKKQIDKDGKAQITDDIAQAGYELANRLLWEKQFGVDNTFVVKLSVDKRVAVNQQFATLRIKDGIADRFNAKFGQRPSVDNKTPEFTIHAHISSDGIHLALDLSGGSLHRRGYRVASTEAPLKENLAAALLYECGWHKDNFECLIDPMCGSGSFIIESLLMYLNYPVGENSHFGFIHYRYHDEILWQEIKHNALNTFYQNLDKSLPKIYGFDGNPIAISATQKNIRASALNHIADKLEKTLIIKTQSLNHLPQTLKTLTQNKVLVISNPPYGERLGDEHLIKPLYQGLGLMLKEHLTQAYIGILASQIEQADTLPIDNPKTLKCHNGALTVYFRHGQLNANTTANLIEQYEKLVLDFDKFDEQLQHQALEFANRLQKNLKDLKNKAKKEQISNIRIYDADLPNFNLAIDIYGNFVHIQEYAPPKIIDEQKAKERFNLALLIIRQVLNINREQIFIKTRKKQSGNEQYSKTGNKGKFYIAKEWGAYLYVNFSDYLDTGLFIDHRNIRQMIAKQSKNKTVLNLFAYTCSASLHSALAGAKSVTSVDLSDNYLTWGKQNFALNGLMVDNYEFIASDVFEWIKACNHKYDVIFIDPPTFSNSKKFKGSFDIQRDHSSLINRAMNRLNSNGVLYFSNNFSKFELDESLKNRYDITDITHLTTGFDFKKGIHKSYEIRHKNAYDFVIADKQLDVNNDGKSSKEIKEKTKDKKPFKDKGIQNKNAKTVNKKSFEKQGVNHQRFDKNNYQKDNQKLQRQTPKRLFVNPKLDNKDEIEQRLKKALDNLDKEH